MSGWLDYMRLRKLWVNAIPASNTADSPQDILLDVVKPSTVVVGAKADSAVTTIGTTATIMSYVKGLLTRLGAPVGASISADVAGVITSLAAENNVPSANATTNTKDRDVIGNKTDTLIDNVGTENSIIAYTKALIQELDQRKVAKVANNLTNNGAWTTPTYIAVVNITDKGVLTGISQHLWHAATDTAAEVYGKLKVTIDGTLILDDAYFTRAQYVATYSPKPGCTNSLAFNHRFNTSLLVEHLHTIGDGLYNLSTNVSYTIDD